MIGNRIFHSLKATHTSRVGLGRKALPALTISPLMFSKRFNSSASTSSNDIKTTLTNFDVESTASSITEPLTTLTLDQIGYLNSIGFAQGWGPTASIERILEVAHVYTGLPWWGTIVATTIAVRCIMFPLYVKASANAAKMSHVKPELDEALQDLQNASNQQEQLLAAQKRKKIMKEHDIKMSHQFFPMLQLPIAYGFFQGLRKMANYPVEGFQTQGLSWFENLSAVDPYCGLQVLTAAVVIGMVRSGGETGAQQMNPLMKKVMIWLPIASIFITKEFSAAVVLYFAANATFSFFQTMLLRSAWFRKTMKMPEMAKRDPNAPQGPATVSEWWSLFNEKTNKKVENKMKTSNAKVEAMSRRKTISTPDNFIKKH